MNIGNNNFLSRTPTAQQLREGMDKWDYVKLIILQSKGNDHQAKEAIHRIGGISFPAYIWQGINNQNS
jgi:hypothetical protein